MHRRIQWKAVTAIAFLAGVLSFAVFWKYRPKAPAGRAGGDVSSQKKQNPSFLMSTREVYERHALDGRPTLTIYVRGFVDSTFDACISETNGEREIFHLLPATVSQFGVIATNSPYTDLDHGKRESERGAGMYDLFWSGNQLRFGLAFQGHFVAAYDVKTGQTIQLTDCRESPGTCRAISQIIERFLRGEAIANAEIERVRKESYGP